MSVTYVPLFADREGRVRIPWLASYHSPRRFSRGTRSKGKRDAETPDLQKASSDSSDLPSINFHLPFWPCGVITIPDSVVKGLGTIPAEGLEDYRCRTLTLLCIIIRCTYMIACTGELQGNGWTAPGRVACRPFAWIK